MRDSYDEIPQNQIPETVRELRHLFIMGLQKMRVDRSNPKIFLDRFLYIYTFFSVIDKLCRRCSETGLERIASPFIFDIYEFLPNGFNVIYNANQEQRHNQIVDYFLELLRACEGRIGFPIEPVLSIEAYVRESRGLRADTSNQGVNHIRYLQKFEKLLNSSSDAKAFQELWADSKRQLPEAYHILYHFSLVTHLLFIGRAGAPFPEEIYFSEDVDNHGERGLRIETPASLAAKKEGSQTLIFESSLSKKGTLLASISDKASEKSSRTSCLIMTTDNFSSKKHLEMGGYSTNEAACASFDPDSSLSLSLNIALEEMLVNPSLAPSLASRVILGHLDSIESDEIQGCLDRAFFTPRLLHRRLLEEKEITVRDLREAFLQALEYYNSLPKSVDSILYIVRTALLIEERFALHGISIEKALLTYRAYVSALLEAQKKEKGVSIEDWMETNSLLITIDNLRDEFPDFKPIVEHFVRIFDLGLKLRGSLLNIPLPIVEEIRKSAFKFQKHLGDAHFLDTVCHSIVKALDPAFSEKESSWKGEFPVYCSGPYILHFFKCTLFHKEKGDFIFFNRWRMAVPDEQHGVIPEKCFALAKRPKIFFSPK